jgi:Arc/MetJ-type ribon-helix-helix transcriptional regulator
LEGYFIMASHKAGRPAKLDQNKRQQLHISLYAEDLERLDRLTDNRSEFIRQCITKAWEEQVEGEATLSVALPKSLVRQLRKIVEQIEPRHQGPVHRTLVNRLEE